MAIIPSTRYPAQIDTGDAGYPYGRARNAGSYQDGTGTPNEKDRINDIFGLQQALLVAAGITPSGVPDKVGASQYLEAIQLLTSNATVAQDLIVRALHLRAVTSSVAISDTQNYMAAIRGRTRGHPPIALKVGAGGVSHVSDWSARDTLVAPLVSITSQVCGAARFPGPLSRVLVIGSGGNACCYSDNEGTSWTAGALMGNVPHDIVANATHDRFLATTIDNAGVKYSADGAAAWVSTATGLNKGQGGIAVLANGDTVAAGRDGAVQYVAFSVSTDGGVTWTATSEGLPDFGSYEPSESGWVCGQARAKVFHAGRSYGRTELRICESTDGVTWTLNKILYSPAADIGLYFASSPRIFMDQETGLLLVTSTIDTGAAVAFASVDQGATWSVPMLYGAIPATAWAVAGGKAFATLGAALYVSDGIARP